MSNMTIKENEQYAIITGGSGYIATNLAEYLSSRQMEVYVISRNKKLNFTNDYIHVIEYDLCSGAQNSDIDGLPAGSIMYHLAWIGCSSQERNNMSLQIDNINLSIKAVELASRCRCSKFIFAGSPLEYQDGNDIINNKAVPAPHNAYGAVKIACHYIIENMCKEYKIKFIYVMISSVYGPGRRQGVIAYTIDSLLKGESPSFTALEQYWDYVHISDVVNGLYLLSRTSVRGGYYCLGAGDNIKLRQYIELISELIDSSIPLKIGEIPYSGVVPSAKIDLSAIHRDTGYEPHVSFKEGLKQIIKEARYE